jgi:hypothetical protein
MLTMIQQKRTILLQSYYKHLLYRSKAGPAIAIYPTQHHKALHTTSSHPAAVRSIPAKDNAPLFSSSPSSSLLSLPQQVAQYSVLYEQLQAKLPAYDNPSHLSIVDYFDPAYVPHKPAYIFNHAASGFAKQGRTLCVSPEESNQYFSVQVGEDSYFKRYNALGVADGVGGWRNHLGKWEILKLRDNSTVPKNFPTRCTNATHTNVCLLQGLIQHFIQESSCTMLTSKWNN